MVAKFIPHSYENRHHDYEGDRFTREQHWLFLCEPGDQRAREPEGRFGDEILTPHSLKLSLREWGGFDDETPSEGRVWTAEVRAVRPSGGHPAVVAPTFLDHILYILDDSLPDEWPDVDARDVIDVELLRYR